MVAAVGRAGFRAVHAKAGGRFPAKSKRRGGSTRAIYEEMLRATDPKLSAREQTKNANILASEEPLNRDFVNDGHGGLRRWKTPGAVDAAETYLERRNRQLSRKQSPNDMELSELVVHLPENLCVADPNPKNVAYVLDDDGAPVLSEVTGKPLRKPRLIPRDAGEAQRYFDDALAALLEQGVIVGGIDAVHARSDQFSEHRPHMQLIFDNYADHPDKPGLRNEFSRVWFSHRDVRYPDGHAKAGKAISGRVKLSMQQDQFREAMIARGWPVEREISPKTKGNSQGKDLYAATENVRIIAEDRLQAARALNAAVSEREAAVEKRRREVEDEDRAVAQGRASLAGEARREKLRLSTLRKAAYDDGVIAALEEADGIIAEALASRAKIIEQVEAERADVTIKEREKWAKDHKELELAYTAVKILDDAILDGSRRYVSPEAEHKVVAAREQSKAAIAKVAVPRRARPAAINPGDAAFAAADAHLADAAKRAARDKPGNRYTD